MGVFDRFLWFSARLGLCGAALYGSARAGVWSGDPEQSERILSTLEHVLQVKLKASTTPTNALSGVCTRSSNGWNSAVIGSLAAARDGPSLFCKWADSKF